MYFTNESFANKSKAIFTMWNYRSILKQDERVYSGHLLSFDS